MSAHRRAPALLMSVVFAASGFGHVDGTEPDDPTDLRPALLNADGANEAFAGIAQLEGLGLSCTGFLVDTGVATESAIVMTNGHCTGLFDAATTLRDAAAPDSAVARFRKFVDTPDAVIEIPIAMVSHATMRSTDVAVLELDTTLGALVNRGVIAYQLGPAPADGDEILVVGIPVDGIEADDQVLRGDTCTAGSTVRLVEFEWLWDAAVATDCAGIRGGNSGSPVFAAGDVSTVVAMVNTTTIAAGPGGSCYLGQPCEVGGDGAAEVENRTYAMPVAGWAACFTGTFVDDATGCPVEPRPSVAVDAPLRAARPGARWAAAISAPGWNGEVTVKSGSAATTDCRVADGYGEPRSIGEVTVFDEPVPRHEGVYVLCAATVDPTGAVATDSAGYAVMQIDNTAPTVDIDLVVRAELGEDTHVEPLFAPPELSSFDVKIGSRGQTDCSSVDGYFIYRRVPILIPAEQRPAIVCVIGEDEAGNRGEPQVFDVP